jgi:class 3 adenylate cyclase
MAYVSTLVIVHAFAPYSFTYAMRLPVLIPLATAGTLVDLIALLLSQGVGLSPRGVETIDPNGWAVLLLYVCVAHLGGLAHHLSRRTDVWESSALRLRQFRLIRSVAEEVARCEQLLANIVPAHLVAELKHRLLEKRVGEGRGQVSFVSMQRAKTAKAKGNWGKLNKNLAAAAPRAASPTGASGTLETNNVLEMLKSDEDGASRSSDGGAQLNFSGLGVLVSESYTGCSILFSKIDGLDALINDDARAPVEVVHLLQRVFDKFDVLAEVFGVQKVRKTANELSIFAAGLPNPKLLPDAESRACGAAAFGFAMLAVMEKLNIELLKWGVTLRLQVGIHSGSVVAGVIGHKTMQWDLCGDAVNTAARMCSYSAPGHVHVSEDTYQLVKAKFGAVCRGERPIKGKGILRTFWLLNLPAEQLEIALQHRDPTKADTSSRDTSSPSVTPAPLPQPMPPPDPDAPMPQWAA